MHPSACAVRGERCDRVGAGKHGGATAARGRVAQLQHEERHISRSLWQQWRRCAVKWRWRCCGGARGCRRVDVPLLLLHRGRAHFPVHVQGQQRCVWRLSLLPRACPRPPSPSLPRAEWVHLECLRAWQRSVVLTQPTHPKYQTNVDAVCNVCLEPFTGAGAPRSRHEQVLEYLGGAGASKRAGFPRYWPSTLCAPPPPPQRSRASSPPATSS